MQPNPFAQLFVIVEPCEPFTAVEESGGAYCKNGPPDAPPISTSLRNPNKQRRLKADD